MAQTMLLPPGCIMLSAARIAFIGPTEAVTEWVKEKKWPQRKEVPPVLWTWPCERIGALVWGDPLVPGPTPVAIYPAGDPGFSVAVAPRRLESKEEVLAAVQEGADAFWDPSTESVVYADDAGFGRFLPGSAQLEPIGGGPS